MLLREEHTKLFQLGLNNRDQSIQVMLAPSVFFSRDLRGVIRTREGRELPSELAEVVVGVEVAPSVPVPRLHEAEKGVRRAGLGQAVAESVERRLESVSVGLEFSGPGSAFSLLHFRAGGKSFGPVDRDPERNGFDERSLQETGCRANISFSQRYAVGVRQVTDHLMHGHFAPAGSVGGRESGDAVGDFLAIGLICKCFHGRDGAVVGI